MASLFGLLHLGASSLQANQAGVQVHGQNVASANSPGYVRRDLQVNQSIGGVGVSLNIYRAEDFVLSQKIAHQHGEVLHGNLMASGLREIEGVLQSGQSSLSQKVAELGRAFSELAAAPADLARRTEVISRGQAVATEFNRVALSLQRIQGGHRQDAVALLREINDLANTVATLNVRARAGTGGALAADEVSALARTLDQRDEAARALAGLVGGEVLQNSDGTLDVLVGGLSLVHGAMATDVGLRDTASGTLVLVGGAQVQLPVGGKLGAALALSDTALATLAQFDRLAFDLSAAVSAQHAFGVGLDGAGARPFFKALGGVAGAALDLKVDSGLTAQTVAAGFTGQPGDNRNALALANLIDQPVLEGGKASFRNVYARIAAQLGAQVQRAEASAEAAEGTAAALTQAREAALGVSTDEEMTRLLSYQRGFEASARFIKIVDEMLQQLTNLK
jgi:flagellar hook-associated protein 1 FlgK